MQVSGRVGSVRDSSYQSKGGQTVRQWSFDLADRTAGTIPCQMGQNGAPPEYDMLVVADVKMIRPIKFGLGYVVVVENVRRDGDVPFGAPPASASVPARK